MWTVLRDLDAGDAYILMEQGTDPLKKFVRSSDSSSDEQTRMTSGKYFNYCIIAEKKWVHLTVLMIIIIITTMIRWSTI